MRSQVPETERPLTKSSLTIFLSESVSRLSGYKHNQPDMQITWIGLHYLGLKRGKA